MATYTNLHQQARVLNEFGEDITNAVYIEFGRVYNEFGDDVTSIVNLIVENV